MLMRRKIVLLFLVCCAMHGFSQSRSFGDLFPGIDEAQKEKIFSPGGIITTSEKTDTLRYLSPVLPDIGIADEVARKKPSFLLESIVVIPFNRNPPDLLGVYNGISKVRDLKGRTYSSFSRGEEVALFEDATRIKGGRDFDPVDDPAPVRVLPESETIFMCLKDVNFGKTYYRADVSFTPRGLVYSLSNFKSFTYFLFTVIGEEKFFARFYMEPLAEGVLLYCVSGVAVSGFIARQVDMPSAISKRLQVIIGWATDGLKRSTP
jgi:hypothetical protein